MKNKLEMLLIIVLLVCNSIVLSGCGVSMNINANDTNVGRVDFPVSENGDRYYAEISLPEGWSVKQGIFEGTGFDPREEFADACLALRLGHGAYTVYSEKGECVGVIGCAPLIWNDEVKANAGVDIYELSGTEFADAAMKLAFERVLLTDVSRLVLNGEDVRLVEGEGGVHTRVCYSTYCSMEGAVDERETARYPAAASFDPEKGVGLVIEFNGDAVSSDRIDAIAAGVRFFKDGSK